jgi:DNA modification methylase
MTREVTAAIVHADCSVALRQIDDASVDAVVTDPPAGIAFMGKEWDRMKRDGMTELQAFQEFIREVFTEVYRVLKPGGHAVVWALPRTSHHTAMGLERAGFDIRDNGTYLFHVFGSGFPKSHNLDGAWEGWGTALKPAVEFWIVARKPLDGTVAENVLAHGTGALNIDGCRIPHANAEDFAKHKAMVDAIKERGGSMENNWKNSSDLSGANDVQMAGRWPAHLILDEGAAATMGEPSRFFYVPKASKRDKDEGLDDLPERSPGEKTDREDGSAGITAYSGSRGISRNSHPTVKSTALMAWLVRLVTPPGGIVLDPFMGSGSTGKAALLEGFSFLGIEREAEYIEIARRRLEHAARTTDPAAVVDVVRLEEP